MRNYKWYVVAGLASLSIVVGGCGKSKLKENTSDSTLNPEVASPISNLKSVSHPEGYLELSWDYAGAKPDNMRIERCKAGICLNFRLVRCDQTTTCTLLDDVGYVASQNTYQIKVDTSQSGKIHYLVYDANVTSLGAGYDAKVTAITQ